MRITMLKLRGIGMSFKKLCFAIDRSNEIDSYRRKRDLVSMDYDPYMKDLVSVVSGKEMIKLKHTITSRILGGIFESKLGIFETKHIMMLDCDSLADAHSASLDLQREKINFCLVVSSYYDTVESEHYWILADYIGSFMDVLGKLRSIRGVDPRYIQFCLREGVFNLRSYPKKYSIPLFDRCKWEDMSKEFRDWMIEFQDYWQSADIKNVVRIMVDKKMCPEYSVERVGEHLSGETYGDIQNFINKDYGLETELQSRVSEIRKTMNAVYGMEIA